MSSSANVAMTAEVFGKRAGLQRLSAGSLISRMQVVPLISRQDAVGAKSFGNGTFGARPPASREDAIKLIGGAREKLLVIVGHVEEPDFVVRSLTGKEEYRIPIDEIYTQAKEAQSEVLLLGCRVACVSTRTGPLVDIAAEDVVVALSAVDPEKSALSLIETLANKTGPMLIQDDHRGGFLLIDEAASRSANAKWNYGSVFARMTLPYVSGTETGTGASALSAPQTLGSTIAQGFLIVTAALIFLPLSGWVLVILFGIGPRRAWHMLKEWRATILELDDPTSPIEGVAIPIYATLGPLMLVALILSRIGLLGIGGGLFVACMPSGLVMLLLPAFMHMRLRRLSARKGIGINLSLGTTYLTAGAPLIFLAALTSCAVSYILHLIGWEGVPDLFDFDRFESNLTSGKFMIPTGIGIGIVSSVHLVALLRWPFQLIYASAMASSVLLEWPARLMKWLERGVENVVVRRFA
ncbi:hypothetical protein [Microvirga massiliensis]|uniref:hypothetical protein n=1 Tax=Microvirga massiliensis TaxID=1033741 RepID=UPI0011CAEC56|nr:hypothetical protein [Microvirga massiliensis]